MKKLFILALAAMFCMAGFAKSTQEVINEITKSTGAQTITLSKDLIAAQAAAMPEMSRLSCLILTAALSSCCLRAPTSR